MARTGPQGAGPTDLGSLFGERGVTAAVAESLTGGLLASRFSQAEGASTWFRGGVVAYSSDVKHELLGVRPGPVVSRDAALDMARGARRVLGADVAVAVTGVGGPDPEDGLPPGTVWIAVVAGDREEAELHRFDGDPLEVCVATCNTAVALVTFLVHGLGAGRAPTG
jgi:nicotinamide-nucleotide amidase